MKENESFFPGLHTKDTYNRMFKDISFSIQMILILPSSFHLVLDYRFRYLLYKMGIEMCDRGCQFGLKG